MANGKSFSRRSRARWGGFTLIEVLVVIGVIVLLIGILLPAIRRARQAALRASCASHVGQIVTAITAYSNAFHSNLPSYTLKQNEGQFLWDIPTGARDAMMGYGLLRKSFYCPANPDQNRDIFWPYHNEPTMTVTGYFFFIPRPTWETGIRDRTYATLVVGTNIPDSHHEAGQRYFPLVQGILRPSEYELVSDAVIAINGSFNTAVEAVGTGTSHLDGNKPQGGNVGFHDGHVEWRRFDQMYRRVGSPYPDQYW